MGKKNKSIQNLGAAIAEHEKNRGITPPTVVQELVDAYLSTRNPAKRQKKIADIKARCEGVNELLSQSSELISTEIEQALFRAATGYTVTERKEKMRNGTRMVETTEKYIAPSQAAIKFYLINKKSESYSKHGGGSGENGEGRLDEILEALRNG